MVYYYTVLNVLVVFLYFTADLLWSFGSLHIQAAANNLTCKACPKGSVGNISSFECKDCPNKGWCKSMAACLKCSPGSFQNSTGQTTCIPCPVGHYQEVSGQSSCNVCQPGSHQDSLGKSTCIKCDKGFFSGGQGSQKCISCGQGSFCSEHGCSKCSPCPVGMEATNMGSVKCTPCLKGHYKGERSYGVCQWCQEGWYQDKKGQGFCKKCPKEYYCPWPDFAPVSCDPSQVCPAGSTAPGTCKGLFVRHHDTELCELSSAVYVVIGVAITGVVVVVGIVLCRRYRRHNEQERRLLERQHPVYTGW